MAVAAVLSVLCAAPIATGAAKPGHHVARNRTMRDVGPAIGTAAGVVFSFFIPTPAFLVLSGRPRGVRGVRGIPALGGICGYGVRLVLQLDHACAPGVHAEPAAFHEAPRRTAFVAAHGI